MQPYYADNGWPTTHYFNIWTTVSNTPTMTVFQTGEPCFSLKPPYQVTVPRPSSMASKFSNYAGVVEPPQEAPHFYNTVIQKPSPRESRILCLERSVFDLVDAHPYLALTDPKLLGWYLSLSPEDRRIIQDEGGFHWFLQRHPALELSSHHVYVKYNIGSTSPAQPSMTSSKHKVSGEKKGRCGHVQTSYTATETPHTRLALEMFPHNARETLTLPGCSISGDESHKHEEICHPEQPVHLGDSFQTNSPIIQELNHHQVHNVSEWPAAVDDDGEANFSSADQSDHFCGIMVDDKSILACLPSEGGKAHNTGVHSGPVPCNSETVTSDRSAEKSTSAVPRVSAGGGTAGTEPALCRPAFTQTEDRGTRDKHVNTEVHMADLDYLAEEFLKLRTAKEEQTEEKKRMKSLGSKMRKECDCVQRAQQAELCLLALQYSMCTQHCWKLCYTCDGGQHIPQIKSLHANITSVLQQLECDYSHMREKILAGVPLEQLEPLSVDLEKITKGACYIPAQIIDDVLGKVPSRSCQELHDALGEERGSPDNQCTNDCQHLQRKEQIKKDNKAWRAVSFVPQDRDAVLNANKHDTQQSSAACKETNASEVWYDAEEVLDPAEPAVAAETGQHPAVTTNESSSKEAKSSVLYVSNLPCSATQSDVMLWFENYHVSEVSISALKNNVRVAIVMTGGPQFAEAAVRELNGCSVRGHTLHVQHIEGDVAESHSQTSTSITDPEFSQDAIKAQTSKTESSSTERKLITEPPLSSIVKIRKVVSISPTAKGTCVPQHYGTMDSFDTLMAELTQHHPDVGRQRIVDALMELKAKHQGVLSSLPLRTIREMTSELLIRPAGVPHDVDH